MTKILFNQPLLDEKGEEIKEGNFTTLKSTCQAVLYAALKGDEGMSGEKKAELAFLALQMEHKPEMDLKAEKISMLKDRIGKACPALIVLRCHRLLEGKPQQLTEEELT